LDATAAFCGLGWGELAGHAQSAVDAHDVGFEVDVVPFEGEELDGTHSRVDGEDVEGV
jgi:hypothetical protein